MCWMESVELDIFIETDVYFELTRWAYEFFESVVSDFRMFVASFCFKAKKCKTLFCNLKFCCYFQIIIPLMINHKSLFVTSHVYYMHSHFRYRNDTMLFSIHTLACKEQGIACVVTFVSFKFDIYYGISMF